jgi:hypothetical protein
VAIFRGEDSASKIVSYTRGPDEMSFVFKNTTSVLREFDVGDMVSSSSILFRGSHTDVYS